MEYYEQMKISKLHKEMLYLVSKLPHTKYLIHRLRSRMCTLTAPYETSSYTEAHVPFFSAQFTVFPCIGKKKTPEIPARYSMLIKLAISFAVKTKHSRIQNS